MTELILITIFQISAAVILMWLMGFFGQHTRKLGYVNFSDIEREGVLAYNLVLRVFAPSVYLVILSTALYLLDLDMLVQNIWMIAIWYAVISTTISITLGRFVLVNKIHYFFVHIIAIILTYFLYTTALNKGLLFILPDSANFRTELWFIVIAFFYVVLSNYQPDATKFYERKKKYIKSRYKFLKNKYQHLLVEQLIKNDFLEKLFFAIMIMENLNRNKLTRFFERLCHPFGAVKTTGVMQMTSSQKLNDAESIKLAQKELIKLYEKYKNNADDAYQLVIKIAEGYNPSSEYSYGVADVLRELIGNDFWSIFKPSKPANIQSLLLPNIDSIKEYKDVLGFLERFLDLAKEQVLAEKNKLDKEKHL